MIIKYKTVRGFSLDAVIEKADRLKKDGWEVNNPATVGMIFVYIEMIKIIP